MELNQLIKELHNIHLQRQELQKKDEEMKRREEDVKKIIISNLDGENSDYENLSEQEFQMLLSDMTPNQYVNVEVAYISKFDQYIKTAEVPKGGTLEDAINLSGIMDECSEIDLNKNKVGIYGMIKPLSQTVEDGERIEIYREVIKTATETV